MFDITLIHPKLVHFTIALFLVVLILDFIGWRMKNERLHHAAWINLIFAAIAALVTAFTGWLAANNVPHNDAVHEMMETHEALGYWVTGIIVVLLIWRKVLGGKFPAKNGWLFFLVTLVGVGLMSYGASLGGDMVYIHGVGVKAVPVKAHNHNGNGEEEHSHEEEVEQHQENEDAEHLHEEGTDEHAPGQADSSAAEGTHSHKDGKEHTHK